MADDSPSSAQRKPRKSNFSAAEVNVLVQLITKNAKYLFGKKAATFSKKQRAWDDVLRGVNALGIEHRTLEEIKNKWKKCRGVLLANKNMLSGCK